MTTHLRGLGSGVVAAVLLGVLAVPASAHSQLVSTSPEDGAVLSVSPSEVTFTFNEDLIEGVDTIAINDEEGNVVASASVRPSGPSVSMPWPGDVAAGTYQVAYRVVSGDGHPVTGAITVTVESDGADASVAPSAVSSAPSPAPTPAPATGSAALLYLAVAAGVVIVAAVIVVGVRRGRSAP